VGPDFGRRGRRKGRGSMVREGEGIIREKKAPERERSSGQVGVGETAARRTCTPENSGNSPANPKQGHPRTEFTCKRQAVGSGMGYRRCPRATASSPQQYQTPIEHLWILNHHG